MIEPLQSESSFIRNDQEPFVISLIYPEIFDSTLLIFREKKPIKGEMDIGTQ